MRNSKDQLACPACGEFDCVAWGDKNGYEVLSCKICSTIYTGHIPDEDSAYNYDEYYSDTNLRIPDFVNQRIEEIVTDFEPFRKSNRLLDIGFGAGSIIYAAKKLGWDVYGQEVSGPVVETFRELGFNVFHRELPKAKHPDGHFDVGTAS